MKIQDKDTFCISIQLLQKIYCISIQLILAFKSNQQWLFEQYISHMTKIGLKFLIAIAFFTFGNTQVVSNLKKQVVSQPVSDNRAKVKNHYESLKKKVNIPSKADPRVFTDIKALPIKKRIQSNMKGQYSYTGSSTRANVVSGFPTGTSQFLRSTSTKLSTNAKGISNLNLKKQPIPTKESARYLSLKNKIQKPKISN